MTSIELINPSAFHPLRVYSQDRRRNVFEKAPTTSAPVLRESRADLEKRGAAITMKKMRVSTKFSSEMRDCPVPLWQAERAESLAHWVTDIQEQQTRDSQRAPSVVPPVQKLVDEWTALQPRQSVPPGGKAMIQLEEHARLAISCDEAVTLTISNTSSARTLRLRTLDTATNEHAHVSFLAPAREYPQAAIVTANGKSAAVIELMPN